MMEGRRYSEGLHQALEAKEGVQIQTENQTLASITFQNYFRLYPKLAGMTGTAMTEAAEFAEIYKLDVVEIPTNRRWSATTRTTRSTAPRARRRRRSSPRSRRRTASGQPVLVGTVAIEKSEALSALLKKRNIPHQVLNARYHEQEALHHRPGRAARRGDDRHQHGRPRHRHPARRQCRDARAPGAAPAASAGRRWTERTSDDPGSRSTRPRTWCSRPAAST